MPTFEVFEERSQSLKIAGTDDSIKTVWNKDYAVQVTLSGTETLASIDAYDVMTATGLPTVNRSIYQVNNKIIPFVICRSKTCKPINKAYTRWTVSTQFESTIKQNNDEANNAPIAKPASIADLPVRVVPVFGETEKVIYQDKSDLEVECARTPAKNWWTEPVMEKIPTLALQITQYESYISYETLLDRKFKVNDDLYRGQARFDWLITEIEPTEVIVELASGPTQAVQITYTVAHSPHLYGWKEDRALIDSQYLVNPGANEEIKLFQNDQPGTKSIGFITIAGEQRGDQTGAPDYIQYEQYDDIDFSSFLRA